jgi:hypothetical protein
MMLASSLFHSMRQIEVHCEGYPTIEPEMHPVSLQDCMSPTSLQILLRNSLTQSPDHPEDFLIMISQSRFRVRVRA